MPARKTKTSEEILKKLPELIQTDDAFRQRLFGILLEHLPSRREFNEILEKIDDTIEEIRELNRRQDEHTKAIRELSQRQEEHSKVLERHSQVLEEHTKAIRELSQRQEDIQKHPN
jgi:methyl-accepting chemotaxis protein